MNPFNFQYTSAIVSRVPASLAQAKSNYKTSRRGEITINIDKAVQQHNNFIVTLRKLGLDVIELQADDTLPDSTFVDCMAVVCNGTALIAKPHLISRTKEADLIRSVLKKEGLNVVDIANPQATIDATDVLFTELLKGREFFVGLSKRTNMLGAQAVASTFTEYPVALIKLHKARQLKAYVSMAGPDLLAIGSSDMAQDILRQIKDISEYKKYKIITITDFHGVNCLYLNKTLLHCPQEEWPASARKYASRIEYARIETHNKEFAKIDRYLTCRALLFAKTRFRHIYLADIERMAPLAINATADQQQQQQQQKQLQSPSTTTQQQLSKQGRLSANQQQQQLLTPSTPRTSTTNTNTNSSASASKTSNDAKS